LTAGKPSLLEKFSPQKIERGSRCQLLERLAIGWEKEFSYDRI
jgi:hypothetical protein